MATLKFYATNKIYFNRMFTFKVNNLSDCPRIISVFLHAGNKVNVAYWNPCDTFKGNFSYKLNILSFKRTGVLIPYLNQFSV